jgi:hypothetical protein
MRTQFTNVSVHMRATTKNKKVASLNSPPDPDGSGVHSFRSCAAFAGGVNLLALLKSKPNMKLTSRGKGLPLAQFFSLTAVVTCKA